jgi:hypothetical protein
MLTKAEKTVLAVLAYSAQFEHPLTVEEISKRLLTAEGVRIIDARFSAKAPVFSGPLRANSVRIEKILQQLVRKKRCFRQGKWYAIFASAAVFKKRRQGKLVQQEKKAVLAEFARLVRHVPWVLGAAVTGSHAVGGARPQDDVDLLVITEKNRVWLSRLALLFVSWRHGRRPHLPGGDISHSWDLNLWLDETRLGLPPQKRTVYEAYEMVQTQWIFDRKDIQSRFFAANPWGAKYLLFWPALSVVTGTPAASRARDFFDWMSVLDWLAFAIQIGYRTLRHGPQKVDKHSAFFHRPGTKHTILSAWKKWYTRSLKA